MKTKFKIITFFLCFILFNSITAQNEYTITKEDVGDNFTEIKVENQNGRFAQYLSQGVEHDFDVDIDYFGLLETLDLNVSSSETIETMWLPDENGGAVPVEVLYNSVSDKLYVFGNRRLSIINPNTMEIINTITVSDKGLHHVEEFAIFYPVQKLLAFNESDNLIYCATPSNELLVISGTTDEILETITEVNLPDCLSTSVEYNPTANILSWVINSWQDYSGSVIHIIDCSNNTIIETAYFDELIFESTLNPDGTIVSTTIKTDHPLTTYEVQTYYTSDLSLKHAFTFPGSGFPTKIHYNAQTDQLNVIFTMPNGLGEYFRILDIYNNTELFSTFFPLKTIYESIDYPSFNKTIFVGYNIWPSGVVIYYAVFFDNITNEYTYYEFNNRPLSVDYCPANDQIYIGGPDFLSSFYGTQIQNYQNLSGCSAFSTTVVNSNVITGNTFEGNVMKTDINCNWLNTLQTSFSTNLSSYNNINDKAYFIDFRSEYNNSSLIILDGTTNDLIDNIEIGKYLTDIEYNEQTNQIFIAAAKSFCVKVVDGNTNNVTETIYLNKEPLLLLSYEDKIYCGSEETMYIIDANTYSVTTLDYEYIDYNINYICTNIDINLQKENIYATFWDGSNGSYMVIIDHSSPQNNKYVLFPNFWAFDIEHNPNDGFVYVADIFGGGINVIDDNHNNLIGNISHPGFCTNIQMAFDSYQNKLFVLYDKFGTASAELIIYDGLTFEELDEFDVANGTPAGLLQNPINDQIYYHFMYDKPDGARNIVVKSLDNLNHHTASILETGNQLATNHILHKPFIGGKPAFNKNSNSFYFGSYDFSNISIINAYTDTYTIRDGWTWLSFPRLERYQGINEAQEPQPVLSRIYEFPKDLLLREEGGNEIEYIHPNWSGFLDELQSTEGYKLQIDLDNPFASPNFEFHGGKLDPTYEISIHAGENWKGYFVEYKQWVLDCIPQDVLDDLSMIKTQDWTLVKMMGQWFNMGSAQEKPLKYGDMVVLFSNQPHTFSWVDSEIEASAPPTPDPEFYSYTEQSDYVPMFVEVEEENDIQEIAVLADGEVKGATVVPEDETLIEVNAYLQGVPPDAEITFETWNGYKSSPEQDNYLVYNQEKNVKEKRTIYAGEHKNFQIISLKQGDDFVLPEIISDVNCFPNPVTDNTQISFRLEEDTWLNVAIMDMSGHQVQNLYNGMALSSYFNFNWNGTDEAGNKLNKGVYVYRISTGAGDFKTGRIAVLD